MMDENKLLAKCMSICSRGEKCIYDIQQKLLKWEADEDVIEAIISKLIAEKFIDEERYVRAFVNDKFKFNHWGRKKIKYNLLQKSVPTPLIDSQLEQISQSDYMQVIKDEIKNKLPKVKGNTAYERNAKVVNYMASKGFEAGLVFQLLNHDDDE